MKEGLEYNSISIDQGLKVFQTMKSQICLQLPQPERENTGQLLFQTLKKSVQAQESYRRKHQLRRLESLIWA
jgi:hypothetical protein